MRWQQILRWAIGAFVVAFAAYLVVSFRRPHAKSAAPPAVRKLDPNADIQTTGKGRYE